jgi:hypothetical protein
MLFVPDGYVRLLTDRRNVYFELQCRNIQPLFQVQMAADLWSERFLSENGELFSKLVVLISTFFSFP